MSKDNPWSRIENPVTKKNDGPIGGERISHPAFGQISASRCSGHVNLYGSDFVHNNFIELRISHSDLTRSLSNDWPHAHDEIIAVSLSEAQWATFVSSLNVGSGVQCTLRHINRKPIPRLPDPSSRADQFKKEASETTARANEALKELAELINESKLSGKAKDELISKVHLASRSIGGSVDYVLKQFGEHMETTVEKAKIEVEAYINDRVMRAGLSAINDNSQPIQLIQHINNKEQE